MTSVEEPMRLLLFADVHLDAPFTWAPPEVARARRRAQRDALARIVALGQEVAADALVCAGDLYEHEHVAADTGAFLRERFAEADRPVLLAPGNHDWLGDQSLYATQAWPSNVHVFTEPRLTPAPLEAPVQLWGLAHHAPSGTPDPFAQAAPEGPGPHLAVVHGSESAGLAWQDQDKRPHAPFDEREIPTAGFAHALCGHHHNPRDGQHHTYPGNPEPLTFGEEGTRGAVLLEVGADGAVTRTRHVVAQTSWHDVAVDVTGAATFEEIRERARAALTGRRGVARLTVSGDLDPAIDLNATRDLTREGLGEGLEVEAVRVRTQGLRVAYDLDALAAEETIAGQLVRDVRADDSLDAATRERVLTVALRALHGRDDLEVV